MWKELRGFFLCYWTWVLQRRCEVRAASQAPVPSGPAQGWAPLPSPAGNVGSTFPAPGSVQTRKAVCGGDVLCGPAPGLSVSRGSVCGEFGWALGGPVASAGPHFQKGRSSRRPGLWRRQGPVPPGPSEATWVYIKGPGCPLKCTAVTPILCQAAGWACPRRGARLGPLSSSRAALRLGPSGGGAAHSTAGC